MGRDHTARRPHLGQRSLEDPDALSDTRRAHSAEPVDTCPPERSSFAIAASRSKPPSRHSVRGQAIAKNAFAAGEKLCMSEEYVPNLCISMNVTRTTSSETLGNRSLTLVALSYARRRSSSCSRYLSSLLGILLRCVRCIGRFGGCIYSDAYTREAAMRRECRCSTYRTRWCVGSDSTPASINAEKWTKTSSPPSSGMMKPHPLE